MSLVRNHVKTLSEDELWVMFYHGEQYEITGVVPEDSQLRKIASLYMENNTQAIEFVLHEVWREFAVRVINQL